MGGVNAATAGELRTFARRELLANIDAAYSRVWLACPFLSVPIAEELAAASSRDTDRRLLTALVSGGVQVGALSPAALHLLANDGWEIRTIRNLHAKLSIVDRSWGLVGSGNLTNAGLGSTDKGNVELGVVLSPQQIDAASSIYEGWWREADAVTDRDISHFDALPTHAFTATLESGVGPALEVGDPTDLQAILAAPDPAQRFWIKANYHRRRPDGREWWHRGWISDWRKASYRRGDLILLYLGAKFDGPRRCPAIVRVTRECRNDPQFVAEYDPDARARWPWVTDVECVYEVPIASGITLEAFGVTPQGLQGGYKELSRAQFEAAAESLMGVAA